MSKNLKQLFGGINEDNIKVLITIIIITIIIITIVIIMVIIIVPIIIIM